MHRKERGIGNRMTAEGVVGSDDYAHKVGGKGRTLSGLSSDESMDAMTSEALGYRKGVLVCGHHSKKAWADYSVRDQLY